MKGRKTGRGRKKALNLLLISISSTLESSNFQHCFHKSRHVYVWIYENDAKELKSRPKRALFFSPETLQCRRYKN